MLGWEPSTPLHEGMAKTYAWIEQQYDDRKAGKQVVDEHHGKDSAVDSAASYGDTLTSPTSSATIPYRMALAGGWIDQPFVSQLNPTPPGSMVVVALEPTVPLHGPLRHGHRHAPGRHASCGADGCPTATRPQLVRELYDAENAGKAEPSGSQDMIGPDLPGRQPAGLRLRRAKAAFSRRTSSPQRPGGGALAGAGDLHGAGRASARTVTARWDQEPRPGVDSPAGPVGQGLLRRHRRAGCLRGLGASMNECMRCWEAILPHTVRHPTLTVDLMGLLALLPVALSRARCTRAAAAAICTSCPRSRCPGASRFTCKVGALGPGRRAEDQLNRVFVTGAFDDLRSGDVRFLQEAAASGPVTCALWSDDADQQRSTGSVPKFPFEERRYLLEAVRYVDCVVPLPADAYRAEPDALSDELSGCTTPGLSSPMTISEGKIAFCRRQRASAIAVRPNDLAGFPSAPFERRSSRRKPASVSSSPAATTGSTQGMSGSSRKQPAGRPVCGRRPRCQRPPAQGRRPSRCSPKTSAATWSQARVVTSSRPWSPRAWAGWTPSPRSRRSGRTCTRSTKTATSQKSARSATEHGIEYVVLKRTPKEGLPAPVQHGFARFLAQLACRGHPALCPPPLPYPSRLTERLT